MIDLLFDPFDKDKNGFIDLEEFTDWYKNYGMNNDTAKVNVLCFIGNENDGQCIFLTMNCL